MNYQSIFRPDLFRDQVFIVTGGGSGIGRCTAHELAALGAKVALVGRKAEKVEAVRAEILEDGGMASAHVCDIREEDAVKATVKDIIAEHGGLNGLVNNAGGQFQAPLTGISQKGWETVVRTNLTGGFLMAREAYTQALSKTGGTIVNIVADMWGGMPGMGHSGAARAGMVNFTQTAAVEWGASGVRVNAVAPGWIASSGMDNYPAQMRDWIRSLGDNVPIKRMGTESEVSAAICFLLSPGAAFISGDCVRIDGAASQGGRVWPLPKAKNNEPFNGFHRAYTPKVLSDD
ncbi:short-chain dehydrogenase/reductase family oxidoreductase [Marinobacter santoriniensis NKSG1]|uniref:Peroxisomal trans-2-enoyl-CoA reductase n=1 Tax=Marinobacter santoriniensis NKSG1 TaxID=1288826 RepID=M7DEJ6_9GAMM|nr:SDR family oxidoreductase [Marinobacter santoriniensis]EMP56087.1 short-chain dehydrogenase/reductase family oxidoreductase [Marinobacter santoriniensis NKSG1]